MVPQLLEGCPPTIVAVRERLGVDCALVGLREALSEHLAALATPVGFGHRHVNVGERGRALQQHKGPDPPAHTP
jgi:hypothetical protein